MMRAFAALCAVVAAAALAGGAAADSTATISLVGCNFVDGGSVTVPAGSTVDVQFGWGTKSRGLDEAFLHDVAVSATVNGTPVADTASYWSTPAYDAGQNAWLTRWVYPTGITLGHGDSITVVWDATLAHRLPDGFGNTTDDIQTLTCTITGE